MRRWHSEKSLLEKRMRQDIAKHNGGYNPLGAICPRHRIGKRVRRRRVRQALKRAMTAREYPNRIFNEW